jgi:hypothetical protein
VPLKPCTYPWLLLLAVSQEFQQPDHVIVPYKHRQTA